MSSLPVWMQVIAGLAVVVTSLGVLWTKVVKPGLNAASVADEMLPLLRELTAQWGPQPEVISILKDVSAQFRNDSGSTLRDIVDSLTDAVDGLREAAALGVRTEPLLLSA